MSAIETHFAARGSLQFVGRCSPLPHRVPLLLFISRKKDGGLMLSGTSPEERDPTVLSSLLFQVRRRPLLHL